MRVLLGLRDVNWPLPSREMTSGKSRGGALRREGDWESDSRSYLASTCRCLRTESTTARSKLGEIRDAQRERDLTRRDPGGG